MKKVDLVAIFGVMCLVLFVFFAVSFVQTFDMKYVLPAIVCGIASFNSAVYCLVHEDDSKR